jgi:hypothetical protein
MAHEECRRRAERQVTSVRPEWSPEEYWQKVRETMPPYFWNRIAATKVERIPYKELAEAIAATEGNVAELIALIRKGDKREVSTRLCEWCNKPL